MLAAAIGTLSVDLVITGNESTDGRTGSVPAMLAERLGWPAVTQVRELTIDGTAVRRRAGADDGGYSEVGGAAGGGLGHREDQRAAVPELQGHHGRQEEAGRTLALADLGVDAGSLGPGERAATVVDGVAEAAARAPARRSPTTAPAGTKVAAFLVDQAHLR